MSVTKNSPVEAPGGSPLPLWLKAVRSETQSLRHGQVQIVIHDSKVVQIERIEKTRLGPRELGSAPDRWPPHPLG